MTYRLSFLIALCMLSCASIWAQQQRWQQEVAYKMEIDVDAKKHQFRGKQNLVYQNNSNETLNKVFYHLYFNAFQPNSMMDVRSRTIRDADPRVGDRILKLKNDEIGFHKVNSLKQNGKAVKFEMTGTILEVTLAEPIKPGEECTFDMDFESQVPLQVRRSGWKNKEGIDFSMTQWYPKMCEYDYQGWHSNPYIGREFHGVWGDFDIKITIDKKYILGGTGIVQNPNEVGYGYETNGKKVDHAGKDKLTWHFKAENVHDFAWAADPDYIHDIKEVQDGFVLHFFYKPDEEYKEIWEKSQEKVVRAFQFIQTKYGKYPYGQYTIIQGGDGGMEYPMATLITGKRSFNSLVGVIIHEAMHTWFQMLMGSNESLYAWMDEGFTSYASSVVREHLAKDYEGNPHSGSYKGYFYLANSGHEEPMSTHADHFKTNFAYGQASYSKGAVFLGQINYIVGQKVFDAGMLKYYDQWHFKHPNPNDFIRVMEKESGLELDWYKEYWVNSTHQIDYAVVEVVSNAREAKDSIVIKAKEGSYLLRSGGPKVNGTTVYLAKIGKMPMPLDVVVTYKENDELLVKTFNIPLGLMRGAKEDPKTILVYKDAKNGFVSKLFKAFGGSGITTTVGDELSVVYEVVPDWKWTHAVYELNIDLPQELIQKIEIDPSKRMADVDPENNVWEQK